MESGEYKIEIIESCRRAIAFVFGRATNKDRLKFAGFEVIAKAIIEGEDQYKMCFST